MHKRDFLKKISKTMVVLMLISAFTPILAFASLGIKSFSYNKSTGTVSATVYSDVYDSVNGNVYLNIYNPDGDTLLKTVNKSVYDSTDSISGVTYYNFTFSNASIPSSVYDSVYLQAKYGADTSSLTKVNNSNTTPAPCTSNCGGYGGGGGGFTTPPTSDGSGLDVPATGEVNGDSLKAALANSPSVSLQLNGETALIPATALLDAVGKAGSMITLVSENGTYTLPLSAMDLDALARSLGINLTDLKIQVTIAKVTGDTASSIAVASTVLNATQIADAIEFSVIAVGPDGKSTPVDFGNTYVSRTINLTKANADSTKVTGVVFNGTTNKLSFVPTSFSTSDGKSIATLKRPGNSIYTVLEMNNSFADIASHWSRNDVQLLANKLIVDGVTETTFEPDRNITRAEFAALVVRSLGLSSTAAPSSAAATFTDVASKDWYASVVAAAAQAKLIDGYEDGSFRPNAQINREELAAMVIRAMRYAGLSTSVSPSQQATLLNRFADSNQIVWADAEIAAAIDAGLINGMTDTTIGSRDQATRAQSATMLKRFLSKAGFIN